MSIAGRAEWSDSTWSYLNDPRMPAMEHGWKLHVSTRPGDLDAVTGLVLRVLARHVCHAKFARDPETLLRINSGSVSGGCVGKAITVYPPAGAVVEIARELAAVLRGREGPRVVSDRRVDPRAPVYYRYGPFTGDYRTGRSGRVESVMTGPDGRIFDGLAVGRYRCPPWAEDPFTTGPARDEGLPPPGPGAGRFGGGRYTVTAGIARKPQGNVYRAVDRALGQPVVVKQARAFVGEDETGADTRDRLRNEHRVLTALDGVAGVPRARDYFRHHADEYLVTSDCGDRDLRREVLDNGPYRDDNPDIGRDDGPSPEDDPYRDDGPRPDGAAAGAAGVHRAPHALTTLASRLLRILDAVHARNVVIRDLKPDNIVLDGPDHCHVVDFGISELDGIGPAGSTPGYSAPVARTTGPAVPADDYYALGATLFFAATGLDPVIVDPDRTVNRDRTLDCLAWALPGPAHQRIRSAITGLLSFDAAVRTAAADRLRTGAVGVSRRPPEPRLDNDLLEEIIEHTAEFCVTEALAIADPVRAAHLDIPTPVDVYGGSAGLGLELLRHSHRPGVRPAVAALAQWTAAQRFRSLPPGLYSGRTGVELFLTEAGTELTFGQSALPGRAPDGGPPEADLIAGAAGIGLGQLLLARRAHERGDRHTADRHLASAADCDRMLASGAAQLTPAGSGTPGSAALREGLAHGEAGIVHFLLEYAAATGDPAAISRSQEAAARLAARTPDILAAAAGPGATRRYGSWCRGLAGIGAVLVRAAGLLDEPAHLALAQRAARACATLAPRMPLVTQCCGLAGVGELMVDVAQASGSEEFRRAAETVALIILSRSGGTCSRPIFPDAGLARPSATWAGGSAGVLAFFRRLHDHGGPRLGLLT
ncbi:class IV lanthionine synthetase LanL [Streptomyces sp. LP11]|uniref:non-specific serine/threonine protein kinase n=1 Tax=Streptomyces pyxinicus TaxID=2970331 RepID=A0ABT2B4X3_9ACTN|nr:class IV lanthionine synthetase LanL [Streptomyces sp. LP11]MCS0603567.1 class IV lanthionine synthetase LanL [Streptomyces sp. LP11]